MPVRFRLRRLYRVRFAIATLMVWSCTTAGGSAQVARAVQAVQPGPLAQQIVVDRLGLTMRYPADWAAAPTPQLIWLVRGTPDQAIGPALDRLAQIYVTSENRRDHADAVRRLREIASEYAGPVS